MNILHKLTVGVFNKDGGIGSGEDDSASRDYEDIQTQREPLQLWLHYQVLKCMQSHSDTLNSRGEQQEHIQREIVIWSCGGRSFV